MRCGNYGAAVRRAATAEIVTQIQSQARRGTPLVLLRLPAFQTRTPRTVLERTAKQAIRLCRVSGY